MPWFVSHLSLVSTLVSIGTLLVWLFYAHLLWKGFSRSERPFIQIHQAGGTGAGSSCLVINLSRQPLHVDTVEFVLRTEGREVKLRLNEYQRITNSEERDWAMENVMKEGPLRAGDFLSLGGFKSMLEGTRSDDDGNEQAQSRKDQELAERTYEFEIRVIAMFSAFERPIGAVRRFSVSTEGNEVLLTPQTPITRQLISARQRKRVDGWLKESQARDR